MDDIKNKITPHPVKMTRALIYSFLRLVSLTLTNKRPRDWCDEIEATLIIRHLLSDVSVQAYYSIVVKKNI